MESNSKENVVEVNTTSTEAQEEDEQNKTTWDGSDVEDNNLETQTE